jgi:hypothetical protein
MARTVHESFRAMRGVTVTRRIHRLEIDFMALLLRGSGAGAWRVRTRSAGVARGMRALFAALALVWCALSISQSIGGARRDATSALRPDAVVTSSTIGLPAASCRVARCDTPRSRIPWPDMHITRADAGLRARAGRRIEPSSAPSSSRSSVRALRGYDAAAPPSIV